MKIGVVASLGSVHASVPAAALRVLSFQAWTDEHVLFQAFSDLLEGNRDDQVWVECVELLFESWPAIAFRLLLSEREKLREQALDFFSISQNETAIDILRRWSRHGQLRFREGVIEALRALAEERRSLVRSAF